MDVTGSSNCRASKQHSYPTSLRAFVASTTTRMIFFGPKKSHALLKLERIRKQHIAPLILPNSAIINVLTALLESINNDYYSSDFSLRYLQH